MNMTEVIGALLIALVVIAATAVSMNSGFSKSKIVTLEQATVTMSWRTGRATKAV